MHNFWTLYDFCWSIVGNLQGNATKMVESGDDHLLIPQKSPKKPLKCQGQIYKRSSIGPHDSWLSTWMSCTRPRPVSCADASRLQLSKLKDETFQGEMRIKKTLRNRGDFNRRGCFAHWPCFLFCTKTRHFRSLVMMQIFFFVFGDPQNLHAKSTSAIQDFSILHWSTSSKPGRFWSKKFELKLRDVNPPEISSFPPWVQRKWRTAMKVMWIFFGFQDPRVSPRETKPTFSQVALFILYVHPRIFWRNDSTWRMFCRWVETTSWFLGYPPWN